MTKKIIGAVVGVGLLLGLSVFIYLWTYNKIPTGYNKGYMPDQPVKFSHQLHAGKLGLDCRYCHVTAAVSRHASVPALNICMNCHIMVRATADQTKAGTGPSPEIAKVVEAFEAGKSIEWEKVHRLPDFVKFNHSAHIKAGKSCQTCHGPVETMKTVYQYHDLSMGWCVNCHRQPENHAPTNCSTCHY